MLYSFLKTVVNTVSPRSSYPFYIVTHYIKWVTTSWTHSISNFLSSLVHLIKLLWEYFSQDFNAGHRYIATCPIEIRDVLFSAVFELWELHISNCSSSLVHLINLLWEYVSRSQRNKSLCSDMSYRDRYVLFSAVFELWVLHI